MALRTKSAKKKQRQSLKKRAKNNFVKSTLRSRIKDFHAALNNNDLNKAEEKLRAVISDLDEAASKGVIHKKTASRHIGRLSRQLYKKKTETENEK